MVYVNRYGLVGDFKYHFSNNKKKYIFGIVLLCCAFIIGINKGVSILNPISGLYQHNKSYYLRLTMIGKDNYNISQVVSNIFTLVLLYACCMHYFLTPISIVILFQKVYAVGVFVALLFRIHGTGAILVVVVAIIPMFIILFCVYLCFVIWLFNTCRECYRYGQSRWLIYETRNIWTRLVLTFILVIIISFVASMLTIALGSSSI